MSAAGVSGFSVTMTTFSTPTDFTSIAALIQNDLAQIGIHVNIVPQDPVTFGANNSAGAFDWDLTSRGYARRRRRLRCRVQPLRRSPTTGSRAGSAHPGEHQKPDLEGRRRRADPAQRGQAAPDLPNLENDLMDELIEIPLVSASSFLVVRIS